MLLTPLAACVSTHPSQAIRNELAPTGTLRAAINYNNPLLAKRDPNTGELTGLAVDLSQELARRAGVPLQWMKIVKESIRTVAPRFSARRMVKEYVERMYAPALDRARKTRR